MFSTQKKHSTTGIVIPTSQLASSVLTQPPGDLAVPQGLPLERDRPAGEFNRFFTGLREMVKACGPKPNKNEVVANVIVACILEGIREGYRITGIAYRLGFNRQHAGMTLRHMTDGGRTSLLWKQGEDGLYYLID